MSKEEGHLKNEVYYVTNEQYINSTDQEVQGQAEEFDETVHDAKMRLDLLKR
ncbi:hypothetical protein [Bacillus sp. AK128]